MDQEFLIPVLVVAGPLLLAFVVVIWKDPSRFKISFKARDLESLVEFEKDHPKATRTDDEQDPAPPESLSRKSPPSPASKKRRRASASDASASGRSWVVGRPIRRDEDFFGRFSQRDDVRKAIENGQSLQILGPRRMGKTSLLKWIERHAAKWRDRRPLVLVNAQNLGGRSSPETLVLDIARKLDRGEEAEEILAGSGRDSVAAGKVLESLLPLVLLVDEAEKLARSGHEFDQSFLGLLRALGQDDQLTWISASHRDLRALFSHTEPQVDSAFLNDEKRIWAGQLEDHDARLLVEPLGEELARVAIRQAAGFAYGLQWLGESLSKDASNVDATQDKFSSYMSQHVFPSWWHQLERDQRLLLKQCSSGLKTSTLAPSQRRRMRELVSPGLLVEHDGRLFLPGAAWRSFVEEVDLKA